MYRHMPAIGELWERIGRKRKVNKGGYQMTDEPSWEVGSSVGVNQRLDEARPSKPIQEVECSMTSSDDFYLLEDSDLEVLGEVQVAYDAGVAD